MPPTPQEHTIMEEDRLRTIPLEEVGTCLSERQWGAVREAYCDTGNAWNYFTHGQARRAPIDGVKTVSL
jgi:hypothetical protein